VAEEVIIEQASDGAATQAGETLTANSSQSLAVANKSRERLIVSVNTADVWLSYGTAAAVVGHGICVRAGQPPFEERAWKGDVQVISAGAAVVGVTETSYAAGDDQGERTAGADEFVPQSPSGQDYWQGVRVTSPAPGVPYP
jgi:hypothetical protein